MAQKGVLIISVEPESLAWEAGLRAGDTLLEINGEPVLDQLSYQFLISQRDDTALTFQRPDRTRMTATVENGGDGIGLDLAQDQVKVCKQNCIFCFVLQMPKGYRKSLYLKDEDIRLSFLYGHFSTLSSSDDAELDRIVREKLSPIHVSVHATDPVVRVKVVGNPKEGDILRKIDRLLDGGVDVHTQAVLVPGINDGEVWERTVRELWERRAFQTEGPRAGKGGVLSLSCVPVGLTSHREGLPSIPDVDPDFAAAWTRQWIPRVRQFTADNHGEPWLLLADEWFTRGGVTVPGRRFYSQSWAQLENGVGLVRKFLEHTRGFLRTPRSKGFAGRKVLVLTGASFAPVLNRTLAQVNRLCGSELRAVAAPNNSFGRTVTVAGPGLRRPRRPGFPRRQPPLGGRRRGAQRLAAGAHGPHRPVRPGRRRRAHPRQPVPGRHDPGRAGAGSGRSRGAQRRQPRAAAGPPEACGSLPHGRHEPAAGRLQPLTQAPG